MSKFLFSLLAIIRIGINVIEVLNECVVLLLINKEIVLTLLKDLCFVLFQHNYINPTGSFESFVIIVEVIMNFNTKNKTGKKKPVNIKVIEREVIILHHISIHDDNRNDKTFRWESCEFMHPSEVVFDTDIRNGFAIEYRWNRWWLWLLLIIVIRVSDQVLQ